MHKNEFCRGENKKVTNFLSAFGDIKETNITAFLGYLIHINEAVAEKCFDIKLPLKSVHVELSSGKDRYDIVVLNSFGQHALEVKIDTHSAVQLHRYDDNQKNFIVVGNKLNSHNVRVGLRTRFKSWEEVVKRLRECKHKGKKADHYFNRLVDDFIMHLEEHDMIKSNLKDIYLRDLSGDSVEWYFNKNIFFTQAKFYDSARSVRYFAPYLTGSNHTKERLSVFRTLGIGISFVSKIEDTELLKPAQIVARLKQLKWTNEEIDALFVSQKWKMNTATEYAVFFLGSPMRLFQRPVTKYDLWGVKGGAMPSFAIDFGDLIAASNGLLPLRKQNKKKVAR